MVRTKEQYMKDLGRMKPNLYHNGEEIDRLDDRQIACLNTIGTTFEAFDDPEYKDARIATSAYRKARVPGSWRQRSS